MSQNSSSLNVDVLEKVAAFVLSRKSQDFRSELYEYLAMMALNSTSEGQGIKKKAIISSIEKDLRVEKFPAVLVDDALGRLESKGWVKKVHERKDATYFLAQDEKTKLGLIENNYSQTIAQVRKNLGKKMTEKGIVVDLANEGLIFSTFRNFLSLVLSSLGKECCFDLIKSHGQDKSRFEPVNISDSLKISVKSITDVKQRKIQKEVARARAIDEEVLLAFQGKWMDESDLMPNDIARILGNRYVKDYLEKSKTEEKTISEEDKEKIINSAVASVRQQNKEIEWMKRSISKLQKESEQLKTESTQIKSESAQMKQEISSLKAYSARQRSILYKVGHVIGALLFLGLSFTFYEYFLGVHSVEHWTALVSAMILSAAVGAIADLGGYRWLLDRLLRYKETKTDES